MAEWPFDYLPAPLPGVGAYTYTPQQMEAFNDGLREILLFPEVVPVSAQRMVLTIAKRRIWMQLRRRMQRSHYPYSDWEAGISFHHRGT